MIHVMKSGDCHAARFRRSFPSTVDHKGSVPRTLVGVLALPPLASQIKWIMKVTRQSVTTIPEADANFEERILRSLSSPPK